MTKAARTTLSHAKPISRYAYAVRITLSLRKVSDAEYL